MFEIDSGQATTSKVAGVTYGKWGSILGLAFWLAVCFGAAVIGSLFMPGDWYAQLKKPTWNPPAWIFGPVWTVLYTLMAIAAWLVWRRGGFAVHAGALASFLVQLLLNALWSPLFFGLRNPALAFLNILLLWAALAVTLHLFWKVRKLAGGLLVPYFGWVSFAAALNYTLWRLNS